MDIPDELLLSDSIPIEALQSFFMIPIVSPSPHIFEATGPGETASVEPSYLEEAKISGKNGEISIGLSMETGETMIVYPLVI